MCYKFRACERAHDERLARSLSREMKTSISKPHVRFHPRKFWSVGSSWQVPKEEDGMQVSKCCKYIDEFSFRIVQILRNVSLLLDRENQRMVTC